MIPKGAAAKLGDGNDVERLEQNLAGADVGGAAIGEDAGGQDDVGDAAGLEQLLGAFEEKGLDTVGGIELINRLADRISLYVLHASDGKSQRPPLDLADVLVGNQRD